MSDENITDSNTGNAPDELPKSSEISASAMHDADESKALVIAALSQDAGKMAASFPPPQKSSGTEKNKEQRKAPRFRVKWHTHITLNSQGTHHGFIDDISIHGASVFLNNKLIPDKWTLHIHVPPLGITSKPHVIEVSGKTVYIVYDGNKQLYRAAINFLIFNPVSNLAYLGERLARHQVKIPEY